jgi:repressor LexA
MIPKKTFIHNLKKLRELVGKNQFETAEDLCIARTRYACWESGKSEPNLNMLAEIGKVFNVSLDDLLNKEL